MSYTCPRCSAVSYSPEDERHGYCGRCHTFTGDVPPQPPENVHVQWSDGADESVDCTYVGIDPENGTHLWQARLRRRPLETLQPNGMTMDVMPAHSSIVTVWATD